jgi:hypothetical protein
MSVILKYEADIRKAQQELTSADDGEARPQGAGFRPAPAATTARRARSTSRRTPRKKGTLH